MLGLVILFAILAIIFGFWGFGLAAATVWVGVKVLFWVWTVLLLISFFSWLGRERGPRPMP